MKRLWVLVQMLVVVGLVLLGAGIGFAVGMYEGFQAHVAVSAVPQGARAAGLLLELETGQNKATRLTLENQVDEALYYYPLVIEQWWYPVLAFSQPALYGTQEAGKDGNPALTLYEQDLKGAAVYRKNHVAPLSALPLLLAPLDPKLATENRQSVAELKRYRAQINATAEKYAP